MRTQPGFRIQWFMGNGRANVLQVRCYLGKEMVELSRMTTQGIDQQRTPTDEGLMPTESDRARSSALLTASSAWSVAPPLR